MSQHSKQNISPIRHLSPWEETNRLEYLYDPALLKQLDFSRCRTKFNPPITATDPGETWLLVRPLQRADIDKGFIQLLSQLTSVGNVTRKQFNERFTLMKNAGGYYVTVVEDTRSQKIIGSATLTLELKFTRNLCPRGRLEDVVVNTTYRGNQLGKLVVATVTVMAEHFGCYKMSLDCKDSLIGYYKALGYTLEPGNSNTMTMRFDPS